LNLPGESLICSKRQTHLVGPADLPLVAQAFKSYIQIWDALVVLDRQGRLQGAPTVLAEESWAPFAHAVVREYRNRRAKATHALRMKSERGLSSVPMVGPLEALLEPLATSGRLKRSGKTFVKLIKTQVERIQGSPLDRLSRVYHCQDVEDIGLAATPTGLDIVVINRRKPRAIKAGRSTAVLREDRGSVKTYHADYKQLLKPGFLQELYRHVIAPKANTVALDVSMLPNVTGNGRHAISLLNRLLRARKVEGTIEFRKVSPMGEDIRGAIDFASASGLGKVQIRLLKKMCVMKCPHCGAPMAMKINPETLTPVDSMEACLHCRAYVSSGSLLATRASVHAHYAFFEHQVRSKPRPDRID
jgi:hypothetical protein